jgi:hypothetical protein
MGQHIQGFRPHAHSPTRVRSVLQHHPFERTPCLR